MAIYLIALGLVVFCAAAFDWRAGIGALGVALWIDSRGDEHVPPTGTPTP